MSCYNFLFGAESIALIAADTSNQDEEAEGHGSMQTVSGQEGTVSHHQFLVIPTKYRNRSSVMAVHLVSICPKSLHDLSVFFWDT